MKKITEYDRLRVLLTFLVVLGHCTALGIQKGGFSEDYVNPYINQNLLIPIITEAVRKIIYSFHMPAFVALSGSVFVFSLKHSNFGVYVGNRAKRLLIPYLLTGILLWIPVRVIIGAYDQCVSIWDFFCQALIHDLILTKNINYLWFCVMLFEVNIIAYFIYKMKVKRKVEIVLLLGLVVVAVLSNIVPLDLPFQIMETFSCLAWFYMGMLIEKYREELLHKITIIHIFVLIVLFVIITFLRFFVELDIIKIVFLSGSILKLFDKGLALLLIIIGICMMYGICFKTKLFKICEKWASPSFDIYLFAVPFSNLWVWLVWKLIAAEKMNNVIYLATLVLKVIIGIIGALMIYWIKRYITMKTRAKNNL